MDNQTFGRPRYEHHYSSELEHVERHTHFQHIIQHDALILLRWHFFQYCCCQRLKILDESSPELVR